MQKIVKIMVTGFIALVAIGVYGAENRPQEGDTCRVDGIDYRIDRLQTTVLIRTDNNTSSKILSHTKHLSRLGWGGLFREFRTVQTSQEAQVTNQGNGSAPAILVGAGQKTPRSTYTLTPRGKVLGYAAIALAVYANRGLLKRAFNKVIGWFGR